MKLIRKIIAVICIFIAIYNFDLHNFNRSVVSILLLMSSALILIKDKKINEIIRTLTVALAIFLLIKLIFVG